MRGGRFNRPPRYLRAVSPWLIQTYGYVELCLQGDQVMAEIPETVSSPLVKRRTFSQIQRREEIAGLLFTSPWWM